MKKDECHVHGLEEKVKGGLEDWSISNRIETGTLTREGCEGYKIGTRRILFERHTD
jgi:hypothetical protein